MGHIRSTAGNVASKLTASQLTIIIIRLIEACASFLVSKGLIKKREEFFSQTPPKEAPTLIIAWIMNDCDAINLDGTAKDSSTVRSSYTHAQKMHASMTYVFGRMYGLGSLPWHYDNTQDLMVGNPSVSEKVSSYMVSLRRRKVQAGEVASSARAITPVHSKHCLSTNHTQPHSSLFLLF
ncbi:hypothetical protein BYT27DRAFT_6628346 [Phlegmacium glaucopus]|nr:hypothetical protein BYT27DRAFT_6628346 [Phlegmacium glaucopus]